VLIELYIAQEKIVMHRDDANICFVFTIISLKSCEILENFTQFSAFSFESSSSKFFNSFFARRIGKGKKLLSGSFEFAIRFLLLPKFSLFKVQKVETRNAKSCEDEVETKLFVMFTKETSLQGNGRGELIAN